jgi:hypothetical protein
MMVFFNHLDVRLKNKTKQGVQYQNQSSWKIRYFIFVSLVSEGSNQMNKKIEINSYRKGELYLFRNRFTVEILISFPGAIIHDKWIICECKYKHIY